MILPEEVGYLEAEGMEKTYNFRQEELAKNVDINTSKKVWYLMSICVNIWDFRTPIASSIQIFNLDLKDFGPYSIDYTRNGRFVEGFVMI